MKFLKKLLGIDENEKFELDKQVITLKTRVKELEGEHEKAFQEKLRLKEEVAELKVQKKQETEELKLAHKTAEEDIKHLVKLHDEKKLVEFERKALEMERKKDEEIAKVKDEYRDKMEKQLAEETKNIRGMYTEILARLPNVNVKLAGTV